MACSLVKISLDQYEQLDRLRREKKESLSKLIQEALSYFIKKKGHSISVLPSFLPTCPKDQYKTFTAYFPTHDWDLLGTISKNSARCKTELLRIAVEDYLRGSP
jgi:predicted CopG family antitoxin